MALATVLAVFVSFVAGYWIADMRAQERFASSQLSALEDYVALIAYLRSGRVKEARSYLYTAVDRPLSTFSSDGGASLLEHDLGVLRRLLPHLNEAWAEDRPFEGEEWDTLRKLPEWRAMRERNDAFRAEFAEANENAL